MAERGFLDQAMDFADGVVGTLEAATGGGTPAAGSSATERASRPSGPSGPWRIIEVIREDHEIDYIVTDGREEISCSSRKLAEKVRDAFR